MKQTTTLVILDGWGIGRPDQSNPLHVAKLANIDFIKKNFPSGALQASGIAVGLPWEEEGNSEVGHLTIGAGKVIYQHFPRITLAIRDGSFFKNQELRQACEHAKKNRSALHLVGLLTQGSVHASFDHLEALLALAKKEGVPEVNLHLFTDGKDSAPKSAPELLEKLKAAIKKNGVGAIASLSGRYFALDRDQHWDRTERVYRVLTGEGELAPDAEAPFQKIFARNLNEEFLEPTLVGPQNRGIKENDAVIFFNFREDSMRQLAEAFADRQFKDFPVKNPQNLYLVTLTRYSEKLPLPAAFQPGKNEMPLGKVLEIHKKTQLRITETEKYAHVTYFFNGFRDAPFEGEYRVLIPSQNVSRHDQYPEMMAPAITERAVSSLKDHAFDFILINYANPDVIAHTGNYEATVKAVETVDAQIGLLVKTALEQNQILIITSDHGNAERLLSPLTGLAETKHDPNPVPLYLVAKEFQRPRSETKIREAESEIVGILADVAPTVLALMNIPKPKEMTGQNLLKFLK